MEDWQYFGLIANGEKEKSCNEISAVMKQSNPGLQELTIHNAEIINKQNLYDSLTKALLEKERKRLLTVIGHGRYHHFTYGLCKYADSISRRYSYIHFDHHCDSWRTPIEAVSKELNCRNFIPFILEDTNARSVLYLGTSIMNEDEDGSDGSLLEIKLEKGKSLKEKIAGFFDREKLGGLIDSLEDEVYISMDMDVMEPEEIVTGYSRGHLTKKGLFDALVMIKRKKKIIGADIVGYSNSLDNIKKILEDDPYADVPAITFLQLGMEGLIPKIPEMAEIKTEDIHALKEKSYRLYQDIAKFITK